MSLAVSAEISVASRPVIGVVVGRERAAGEVVPVVGELVETLHDEGVGLLRVLGVFGIGLCRALLGVEQLLLDGGDLGGDVGVELLCVDLVERRVVLDEGVAARLGDGGVVDFGVAVAAVADEVDDDVGGEGVAVVGGEGGDADDGFGVLGVDVEDGDGQALGEVGGEARAVGLFGIGGEAEQVVDDDLDGAADGEAVDGGEIEGLGPDALAGEGGVAVDDHGQSLFRGLGVATGFSAVLTGAGAAHNDGVGGLEMRRVGGEVERDGLAVGGGEVASGAHVVLDVAAAHGGLGVDVLELGEDFFGLAADGVDHDVEAAAVAHREDGTPNAVVGGGGEELVEERDEDGEPFQREALGAEVALLDDLLEEVGADEIGEDALLVDEAVGGGLIGRDVFFEALLDPGAALWRRDVHELGANGAAVVAASFLGGGAIGSGRGKGFGREVLAERVEGRLQVAPAAEDVEDGFAGGGGLGGGLGFSGEGLCRRRGLGRHGYIYASPSSGWVREGGR